MRASGPTPDGDSRSGAVDRPGLTDAEADVVFDALAPETAREYLALLEDEPRTLRELADAAGTSVRSARYHLDKLAVAGLVEIEDGETGERAVYAPALGSLPRPGPEPRRFPGLPAAALAVAALVAGAVAVQAWAAGARTGGVTAAATRSPPAALAHPGLLVFAGGALALAALGAGLLLRRAVRSPP